MSASGEGNQHQQENAGNALHLFAFQMRAHPRQVNLHNETKKKTKVVCHGLGLGLGWRRNEPNRCNDTLLLPPSPLLLLLLLPPLLQPLLPLLLLLVPLRADSKRVFRL